MSFIRGALALGAALVAASVTAGAADLGRPPAGLKDYGYAPVSGPNWYVRIDGGYAFHSSPAMVENTLIDLSRESIDDTWTLGGGVGRYFTPNLRGDVTYDYRFNADVDGFRNDPNTIGPRAFGIESGVLLANLYYDFDLGRAFKPYIGIGLGAVHHSTKSGTWTGCGCTGTISGDDSWDVAGAAMAGFTVNLRRSAAPVSIKDEPVAVETGRGIYLDVGYRFLYLGDAQTGVLRRDNGAEEATKVVVEDIMAHEFRVGLRFDIR